MKGPGGFRLRQCATTACSGSPSSPWDFLGAAAATAARPLKPRRRPPQGRPIALEVGVLGLGEPCTYYKNVDVTVTSENSTILAHTTLGDGVKDQYVCKQKVTVQTIGTANFYSISVGPERLIKSEAELASSEPIPINISTSKLGGPYFN